MTKKAALTKIGMTCSRGVFCAFLKKDAIFSNNIKVCDGDHHHEIFNSHKEKEYTQVFDTLRPQYFIGGKE